MYPDILIFFTPHLSGFACLPLPQGEREFYSFFRKGIRLRGEA